MTRDTRGNIWAATNNGIFYMVGNRFSRLEIPELISSKIGSVDGHSSIKKLDVYCITGDKKGNIWFGTESEGLWKFDGIKFANYKFTGSIWMKVPKDKRDDFRQKAYISAILADKNGTIWFSSIASGLNYFDGKSFHQVKNSAFHILQLLEDTSGNIWMGTRQDGVARFNGQSIKHFMEKDGDSDNMASCIYQAKNGKIWFGSLGKAGFGGSGSKGLMVYNGKTFTPVASTGMRNNQVWTILEDNSGGLWVGTKEFGLYRYDGKVMVEMTALK